MGVSFARFGADFRLGGEIDRLARASLDQDIRSISGAPNWLLLFFEKLFTLRPACQRLAHIYFRTSN